VLFNSAAALVAADRASDMREGLELARESLRSGKAQDRLGRMIAASQSA
jgi:anthranilate phosphoribosyltransferase